MICLCFLPGFLLGFFMFCWCLFADYCLFLFFTLIYQDDTTYLPTNLSGRFVCGSLSDLGPKALSGPWLNAQPKPSCHKSIANGYLGYVNYEAS